MSEPALFVFIQGGEKRYFYDRWAAPIFMRELMWGPEALQRWLTDDDELETFTDEIAAGAVIDFDRRHMVWYGECDALDLPRLESAINRMISAAWPGFEVAYAVDGEADLAAAAGEPDADEYESSDPLDERPEILEMAGSLDPDDQLDGLVDEDGDEIDLSIEEDEMRAWVTLIGPSGAVGHRQLHLLSGDLIRNLDNVVRRLDVSAVDEIPSESMCSEGMWIDETKKEIGLWGTKSTKRILRDLEKCWSDWSVQWVDDGYSRQCAVSGPEGEPMTDEEALARIMPILISTERFDVGTVFRHLGDQLKTTGRRAAGCLAFVLCLPFLLFGLISGNWKAAGMAVALVFLSVAIVYQTLEYKVRNKFKSFEAEKKSAEPDRPDVPGPLDEGQRRKRIEKLLAAAGLPSLSAIESAKRYESRY